MIRHTSNIIGFGCSPQRAQRAQRNKNQNTAQGALLFSAVKLLFTQRSQDQRSRKSWRIHLIDSFAIFASFVVKKDMNLSSPKAIEALRIARTLREHGF